jgi:hypothetical protein
MQSFTKRSFIRLGAVASICAVASHAFRFTSANELAEPETYTVPCGHLYEQDAVQLEGCTPRFGDPCRRYFADNLISSEEVARLRAMMDKAFAFSTATAGPAIVDIHSGYLRDTRLVQIYNDFTDAAGVTHPAIAFDESELQLYNSTFTRIRSELIRVFGLSELFFTAPTFVTRIIGSEEWQPRGIHDEYWHDHVDKANTPHYDFSGLLYLSTLSNSSDDAAGDFTGGSLRFLSPRDGTLEHTMEPRAGRFVAFTSGEENPHAIERVRSGTRYVFSMWFTCDEARKFDSFLDGRARERFMGIAVNEPRKAKKTTKPKQSNSIETEL